MRWKNLLTVLSLVAIVAWVSTAPLTAQGHLPEPEPPSTTVAKVVAEPPVLTVSTRAGSSFDDTVFLVRIQSPDPLVLNSEESGEMPELYFEVSGDSFQKSFGKPLKKVETWALLTNQVAEWSVRGSDLRVRTATGDFADETGPREVPAGPFQVKVGLVAPDPNSNEFSRGVRFLHIESETVTVGVR